jgi:hypothetical protein
VTVDHTAVGRLIRYGLEPKLTPARSADYAELVGRARNDSDFAGAVVETAHGQGLEVLNIDPLLGISLAATEDSPFAMRLDDYSRGSNEDRLLHALVHLAIAATAFPTSESLDDDRLQSVSVGEVVERIRHISTRLRDKLGLGDPPEDEPQLEPLYRFVLRMPVTGTTTDERAHLRTLVGAVKRALRFLVDQGMADPLDAAGPDTYRLRARYRIHVRDAASYVGDALDAIREAGR